MATGPRAPRHYALRVDGHLDRHWSGWFGGFAITHHDDGTTTLHGPVDDQAQLHGLLAKVRDLGATLIAVTPADERPPSTPGPGVPAVVTAGRRRPRPPSPSPPAGRGSPP